MDASKISYRAFDDTAFCDRKKKVQKEHSKKEKIKEGAKKMALFLAGLAGLGAAAVVISSKKLNENEKMQPNSSKSSKPEEKNNKDKEQTPSFKKENHSKDKKAELFYNGQKMLAAKEPLLMLPPHKDPENGLSSKDALVPDALFDNKDKEQTPSFKKENHSKDKKAELFYNGQKMLAAKEPLLMLPPHKDPENGLSSKDALVPDVSFDRDSSSAIKSSQAVIEGSDTMKDEVKLPSDDFLQFYQDDEAQRAEKLQEAHKNQLEIISAMLNESLSELQEGLEEIESINLPEKFYQDENKDEFPDIDSVILDMRNGKYGKSAQNTVEYHLDDAAVEIYKEMSPETIGALSAHFIEMTVNKNATGGSDKAKLKRLKTMEKKFTPSGIKKIMSTDTGSKRLLAYIQGIEYVDLKPDANFYRKITNMQKYMQAKKENLNWLYAVAKG